MAELSSVDVDLDAARAAFDTGIDGVAAAMQQALDGIRQQVDLLETTRADLERQKQRVEAEIDELNDRAAQLEALVLPGPVGESLGLSGGVDEETEVVYVEVDEHGNEVEVEYVDEDEYADDAEYDEVEYVDEGDDDEEEYVEEILLEDAPWADLAVPRTDRLVALVEFHGELTTAEAVEALAEVGDEVSTSTVAASLGNLARQGRITKLDAGLFGPA